MITVIIPAHNEAEVIEEGLRALLETALPNELEVLVVCNGCTDDTAARASAIGGPIRVLTSEIPSKTEAINLALDAARGDDVVVADADIVMRTEDLRALVEGLSGQGVLASAPTVKMVYLPDTSWAVRAYYDVWLSLPYIKEGMMGAGVYAMNRLGLSRVGRLPRVIADDGYVRALFNSAERIEVLGSVSRVKAPITMEDLIKIKTRSRVGGYELKRKFPDLFRQEAETKQYGRAFVSILMSPFRWPAFAAYLWVNLAARTRALAQARDLECYRWERDVRSRQASAARRRSTASAIDPGVR